MAVQETPANVIRRSLEVSRAELLDLGLRSNSPLNYRLLRARGLEVLDERPAQVYKLLVEHGRELSFLPASEEEPTGLVGQPKEDEPTNGVAEKLVDSKLHTRLTSQELQSRLLSTYQMANTFIQEQGINTLFLALGMLTWYDSEDSEEARLAPLFMIPVALNWAHVRARFILKHTD